MTMALQHEGWRYWLWRYTVRLTHRPIWGAWWRTR